MRILVVSRIDDEKAVSYAADLGKTLEAGSHSVIFEKALAARLGVQGKGLGRRRPISRSWSGATGRSSTPSRA